MALIKCPECGKEVSDKAEVCIHCGYPLKPQDTETEAEKQESSKQEASEKEAPGKKGKLSSTFLVILIMAVLCAVGYAMMSRLAYGG